MTNRYVCDVLDEARTCIKTLNFSYLLSLLEEIQVLANRMEASLRDKRDVQYYKTEIRDLKKEIKNIKKEITELEDKKESLED